VALAHEDLEALLEALGAQGPGGILEVEARGAQVDELPVLVEILVGVQGVDDPLAQVLDGEHGVGLVGHEEAHAQGVALLDLGEVLGLADELT
jgi:hypothetical protein